MGKGGERWSVYTWVALSQNMGVRDLMCSDEKAGV